MIWLSILFMSGTALLATACLVWSGVTREKVRTALIGIVTGWTISGLIFFMGAPLGGVNYDIIAVFTFLTWLGALALIPFIWRHWHKLAFDKGALILFAILLILAWPLASRLLFEKDGGIMTGIPNAWGDLGWHVSNITYLAANPTVFPPQDPSFAGTPLFYPYLINFFSALLVTAGATISASVMLPTVILLPLVFTLLYCFVSDIAGRRAAAVALVLAIFCGAIAGSFNVWHDLATTSNWLTWFMHLPRDYSGAGSDPTGLNFTNIVTAGLLPQRSLLLGMALAFAVLILVVNRKAPLLRYGAAGLLAGTLPLAHAHTAIVLAFALACLTLAETWQGRRLHWKTLLKAASFFLLGAIITGIPAASYYLFAQTSNTAAFFRFEPGWTMPKDSNFIWFWFQNTGLIFPLALLILFFHAPKRVRAISVAALSIFALGNLFLFAPWAWDNYKLLIYAYLLALPAAGWFAARAVRWRWYVALPIILLIAIHSLTGALDVWRLAGPESIAWSDWDASSRAFAAQVTAATKPTDIILTATYHNHPLALTGRAVYLGYAAHVWSHGGNPWPREQAVKAFYQNQLALLPDITPQYAVVGPIEHAYYPNLFIRPEWQVITSFGPYTLYRI